MKVKELKKRLKNVDDEAEIVINMSDSWDWLSDVAREEEDEEFHLLSESFLEQLEQAEKYFKKTTLKRS